ncbi:MAG: GNAT family N-acetyltransferase [Oceanospirillaceae bacterium]|nr:GNAT family N-acetyltransferase [Oceanospirillaceae bacterium]
MYEWKWKRFEELSSAEIYEILRVRQEVFVVEQNCVYQDVDSLDQVSWHLFAQTSNGGGPVEIHAYLRVVYPGHKYTEPSIGRVLTAKETRGQGQGRLLLEKAMEWLKTEYPKQQIRISAQKYLEAFYADFGFTSVSEPYDEDGIPHIEMVTALEPEVC